MHPVRAWTLCYPGPRGGYLMSVWRCARLDKNPCLMYRQACLKKFTHFYWHVPKNLSQNAPIFITCTYYLIGSVYPGTATEFSAANIFQPISGQHCLLRHPSGRYAQRNQSLLPKMPWAATDSDKNVMIPVSEWVSEWVSECICDDYFISSLVVDCVNVNVRAYVLQVGRSIVALGPIALFNPFSMCDEIKYV